MPDNHNQIDDKLHWYKDAVIYELHIKAFRDGNCDGIGDFKGLLERLDYLQNLGVTAIWLLPFYPSPLKDDGYDIADYYSINPSYGDLKEFKQFLREAHNRNLKVITELVINHTSDQHPWFQRARKAPKGSPYRDFYVWTDDPNQFNEVRIIFQDYEGSNWTWDPVAQQYYWHRFFHHQPDLNYDNPLVQQEVFKIIDYWCKMGVDGFRLDAVPYLFEREGTNCENLPETHEYLKKLRKHVDDNFPGTLLLAEANMWPEDSAAYFGDGDECHMNYHFPVMPRMFMSLQMEDRYPLTDIFEQTPTIPETCQWAMFLRNHDELTLEMVTDEERDYMYKVYVKDPKARINLGIRHRLAPLMDNSRKKIELLNYLLFSFPGTPVIYYGDEIGMGDNFYLGDRDGVRTPMQWSSDRNAGFSEANPHRLYLPVILDPSYHYESVNVDIQRRNTSSLLWWTKRIINTRKQYKAFSRGDMKFIQAENSKVLSFTRTYQDETVLVIVNLSRYAQPAELDLNAFKGYLPVEIFSKNKYPAIKEDTPYFFTLSPYDCQWFILEKSFPEIGEHKDLPLVQLSKWKDIVSRQAVTSLEKTVLQQYLMKVRWFGGKGRLIESIQIINHAFIPLSENPALVLLIELHYQSGLPEIYHLPVSFASGANVQTLKENYPQSVLARVQLDGQNGTPEEGVLYDALYGEEYQMVLFNRITNNQNIDLKDGEIQFSGNKLMKNYFAEHDKIKPKVISVEQSNTAISFDNKFFLKIYRKVDTAINPDLEINHFLSKHARFEHIPTYLGSVKWEFGRGSMVLGMVQEMIENSGDAWAYMIERLNDFYENILSGTRVEAPKSPLQGSLTNPVDYEDAPEEIKTLIDASLAERIRLLGIRTGEMHIALASGDDLPEFRPEEYSLHYQRSLYSSLQSLVRAAFQNQVRNTSKLQPQVKQEATEILSMKSDILEVFRRIYRKKIDVLKIRVHGDYHLGQVLLTGKDFVILDFEGEPAKAYSERRLKRSALRDVAGMVRSLHYAAYAGLFLDDKISKEDTEKLIPYAEQWYHYMSGFFMKAYLETVKGTRIIPKDKESLDVLMDTFLLEKAVYELNYELNNRPDWVIIPIRGIKTIMEKNSITSDL
ncbi:maltose alpha-D-glucosyltransferase [Desertivirga xinjiangensis]|uniref:maltose alpha-D-glucosyltransferase n=1 Tax=Desertivirga xinjiangensis TaxID=539206 RepID=UPI0021090A03|nr:maltose alpha-D-glucosyltransferase [Pedobacter xinjiangensis]